MNPLDLLQLQRNRDKIVKAAQRELNAVRLYHEQLGIPSILRRLDELERRLEGAPGVPGPDVRPRVEPKITVYRGRV